MVPLKDFKMEIRREQGTPGHDSRDFTVGLNFDKFELEYTMTYHDTISNQLNLAHNNNEEAGYVHDEAILSFGQIRDEQGYPFLRCNFTANDHPSSEGDLEDIEFVAKRTDSLGIRNLGLTKNEKLRLGYAVRDDGTFEPEDSDEEFPQDHDTLLAQLERHTTAAAIIHARLVAMKEDRDKRLRDATNGVTKAFSSITGGKNFDIESLKAEPLPKKGKRGPKRTVPLETPPPSQARGAGSEPTPQSMLDEEQPDSDRVKRQRRTTAELLAGTQKVRRRRGI